MTQGLRLPGPVQGHRPMGAVAAGAMGTVLTVKARASSGHGAQRLRQGRLLEESNGHRAVATAKQALEGAVCKGAKTGRRLVLKRLPAVCSV